MEDEGAAWPPISVMCAPGLGRWSSERQAHMTENRRLPNSKEPVPLLLLLTGTADFCSE